MFVRSVSQSAFSDVLVPLWAKTHQEVSVFELMKTLQWGPGEQVLNASVGGIFFLRFGCDENGYFQKRFSLVEAFMWMKGWISNLEHSEVRPSYIPYCHLWKKKQPCCGLISTREQCPRTSFWVLNSGEILASPDSWSWLIALTLSWRFRRLTVTTIHRYTSKLVNWYWFIC